MSQERSVVDKLTVKQRRFVLAWLRLGNATKAAAEAGYSNPDKQGSRLAKNEAILAAVGDYYREQHMDAVEVVARVSQQARAVYTQYFYWDEDGKRVAVDVKKLINDGYAHLIKDWDVKDIDGLPVQVLSFQPVYDSQMAIMRHLGLFKDNVDVTSGGELIKTIEVVAPNGGGDGS